MGIGTAEILSKQYHRSIGNPISRWNSATTNYAFLFINYIAVAKNIEHYQRSFCYLHTTIHECLAPSINHLICAASEAGHSDARPRVLSFGCCSCERPDCPLVPSRGVNELHARPRVSLLQQTLSVFDIRTEEFPRLPGSSPP